MNWEQRLAETQLDLDQIWQTTDTLKEAPVGDTVEEELLDVIFEVHKRENLHEPLRIVPIRGIQKLSKTRLNKLIRSKEHMFISRLWELIVAHYKEHNNSLQGFTTAKLIDEVRREIADLLPDDVQSREIYEVSLHEAARAAVTTLTDSLADSIFDSLDTANRAAALIEARKAYQEGRLEKISYSKDKEPTDDEMLLAYIQITMDELIK